MIQRFIHHVRVERPPASETAVEARLRLGEKFPRGATRRMTHLGMLVGSTLEGVALQPEDAVVYATRFAETRALEDFLGSFPTPSPLLFQSSIHPSGMQQVLIGRQQPVTRLWPLAGGVRLVEQALLTALLEPAPRVVIAGGEERGTWLLEQGLASDRGFAFALRLTREEADAVGRVRLETEGGAASPKRPEFRDASPAGTQAGSESQPHRSTPDLASFAEALAERRPLAWRGMDGAWAIDWR